MDNISDDLELSAILDYAWLNLTDDEIRSVNPYASEIFKMDPQYADNPFKAVLAFARQDKYIWWTAKYILGLTLAPNQVVCLQEMSKYSFPLILCTRGFGKSWMLAIYAIIYCLWHQGSKVILVGAGFRQSKAIFDYAEKVWNEAPVLRSLMGVDTDDSQGVKKDNDKWTLKIGQSYIIALPVGTGEKIRGERANVIIADEFACLAPNHIVSTNIGLMSIKDTFKYKDSIKIESGLNPGVFRKPSAFIETPPTQAYKVRYNRKHYFTCSGIHKVFLSDGQVKLAKNLKEWDKIKWAGASFHNDEMVTVTLDELDRLVASIFETRKQKRARDVKNLYIPEEFPSFIHNLSKKTQLEFLKKVFEQKGGIYCHKNLGQNQYHYLWVPSLEIARNIVFMLNRFGLKTFTKSNEKDKHFVCIQQDYTAKFQRLIKNTEYSHSSHYMGDNIFVVNEVIKLDAPMVLYDYQFEGDDKSFIVENMCHHNSMNEDIFERVIAGFNVVSSDPIKNIMKMARMRKLKEMGLWNEVHEAEYQANRRGNQTIISGTAKFQTNHFYKYFKRYADIVKSRGNKVKLQQIFGKEPDEHFDWRDFCVIRIPYELAHEGFLDPKVISRAKATTSASTYANEFGTVFSSDSDGFFKHSLIESCVTNEPINVGGELVQFSATLIGKKDCYYVYGVDPASQKDKLTIVVLECYPNHRRVVYCWSTDKAGHTEYLKRGLTNDQNYYGFIARKLRTLARAFPPKKIAIDTQGGGYAVMEALRDTDKLLPGEVCWYPVQVDDKEGDYDLASGHHILVPIQFSDAKWVVYANHGLRQDMESKILLFPEFDAISLMQAVEEDKNRGLAEGLDSVMYEIEELKAELVTIEHTLTQAGRDHWDVPQYKTPEGKIGRLRKDRYSALIMANATARKLSEHIPTMQDLLVGAGVRDPEKVHACGYAAPEWFTQGMSSAMPQGFYGFAMERGEHERGDMFRSFDR